ncbi:D-alanine--D-alanine ligase [Methylogaea oryzae]|uniref:D-alanine--D-alanine ligase n=1 Tax=Methylogaea oryzae TaxID=1295382 RepID=A0A8D5AI77_9GAMM|nr:D-alanine--D-alanine ligase [Methylogaea oryzae]BBL72238.1 D-alanine--D-alanine ligase B [Methylogaea oryzae]
MVKRVGDPAAFGKVAVVMGGASAERQVSLWSGQAVLAALLKRGVQAVAVDVDAHPVAPLQAGEFDRVFNIVHGRGGEDGVLQGVLEALGLPYTGSGVLASALTMDKLRTKAFWRGVDIPTPDWYLLDSVADVPRCAERLGFPLMVKPALEGSSVGISKVHDVAELEQAYVNAAQFGCQVFAEVCITGAEYTVAVLEDQALPLIRLETPNKFYDFDAKYCADTTQYHCPCGLPAEREQALQALALKACRSLGVEGWGRVDLLVDAEQRPWLIEVNTVPGMTDHSLVPMAARAAGLSFEDLVWRILEGSFPPAA